MVVPRVYVPTRLLALAVVGGLVAGMSATLAFGAPSRIDCRNVAVTTPTAGATLNGAVEIRGRAVVLSFQFYKVEYSPLERQDWLLVGTDVVRTPVESGRLAVWQTTRVPDGSYQLRLRVVDPTGNYCEAIVSPVHVVNARPTETPLPTPTEFVELTVVPPQAAAISTVVIPREVLPFSSTPGALPTRAQPFGLGMPDLLATGAFFFLGVCGMSGILLFVGVFMYVRQQRW